MRLIGLLMSLVLVGACSNAGATATQRAHPEHPVVVELFESQGCSSCPPANANVNALASEPGVLTLIYGVTYWDQLGWKDTFAKPEFTQRQLDYARGLNHPNVYTPQVVLNGREDIVGNERSVLDAAIVRTGQTPFSAAVSASAGAVQIEGAETPMRADVWLVRYDPRTIDVPIQAGENSGRTLPHTHVVREVRRLGGWDGQTHRFAIPAATQSGLNSVVLVQSPNGGPIIGVARVS